MYNKLNNMKRITNQYNHCQSNQSTTICYSKLRHKDTSKDYALELEFLGNAVLYKISSMHSFGEWKLICRP